MWEYRLEEIRLSERWSSKRQVEELDKFRAEFSLHGSEGWELVSYQAVPLTGSFSSDKIRGYTYLAIFKRPKDAESPDPDA